jgi:hypothetical protein
MRAETGKQLLRSVLRLRRVLKFLKEKFLCQRQELYVRSAETRRLIIGWLRQEAVMRLKQDFLSVLSAGIDGGITNNLLEKALIENKKV